MAGRGLAVEARVFRLRRLGARAVAERAVVSITGSFTGLGLRAISSLGVVLVS